MVLNEKDYIKDQSLLLKSITILGLTILGFILHSVIHVDAAVVAMTGATLLMLIGVKEHDIEDVFAHVEWVTIFFFTGLFVLVGGLIDIGLISSLARSNRRHKWRYRFRRYTYFMGIRYRICDH